MATIPNTVSSNLSVTPVGGDEAVNMVAMAMRIRMDSEGKETEERKASDEVAASLAAAFDYDLEKIKAKIQLPELPIDTHYQYYALFLCYLTGTGVPRDVGRAFEWLEEAAANNNIEAQYVLGVFFTSPVKNKIYPADSARSCFWLKEAARFGHKKAAEHLKQCADEMSHLPPQSTILNIDLFELALAEYKKKKREYHSMTDRPQFSDCFSHQIYLKFKQKIDSNTDLAELMYKELFSRVALEIGTSKKSNVVHKFLQDGIDAGFYFSKLCMAWYYKSGRTLDLAMILEENIELESFDNARPSDDDLAAAISLFTSLSNDAQHQSQLAQIELYNYYLKGLGLVKDWRKAINLLLLAIQNCNYWVDPREGRLYNKTFNPPLHLARYYENGVVDQVPKIPKDLSLAYYWYKQAGASGNPLAKVQIKRMRAENPSKVLDWEKFCSEHTENDVIVQVSNAFSLELEEDRIQGLSPAVHSKPSEAKKTKEEIFIGYFKKVAYKKVDPSLHGNTVWIGKVERLLKKLSKALIKILLDIDTSKLEFVLNIKFLRDHFDIPNSYPNPLIKAKIRSVRVLGEEGEKLIDTLLEGLDKGDVSGLLLNELAETKSAQAQLADRNSEIEQKKREEIKKKCNGLFGEYLVISERFRAVSNTTLEKQIEELGKKDVKILALLDSNKQQLEKMQANPGLKDREARRIRGALAGNEGRRKDAEKHYQNFDAACERVKNARSTFRAAFNATVPGMREACAVGDEESYKKMLDLMKALTESEQVCITENKNLAESLRGMDVIIEALEQQSIDFKFSEKMNAAHQQKASEDKARVERKKREAANVQKSQEDAKNQQDSETKEKNDTRRAIQRAKWLEQGRLIHQLKEAQLLKYRSLKQADAAKEGKGSAEDNKVKGDRRAHKLQSRILSEMPQFKTIESCLSIRKYLKSFRRMLNEQFTFSEENQELETYALFAKLAQLLEAMKDSSDDMAIIARAIRNNLYHGDLRKIIDIAKSEIVEQLIDMNLRLLSIDWDNPEAMKAAVFPKLLVRFALYGRVNEEELKSVKEECVATALFKKMKGVDAKSLADKESQDSGKKAPDKPRATKKSTGFLQPNAIFCMQRYAVYKKKRAGMLAKKLPENKAVIESAVGYIEGLMSADAIIILSSKLKEDFRKAEPDYQTILENGRAFRHNRVQLHSSTLAEQEEEELSGEDVLDTPEMGVSGCGADRKEGADQDRSGMAGSSDQNRGVPPGFNCDSDDLKGASDTTDTCVIVETDPSRDKAKLKFPNESLASDYVVRAVAALTHDQGSKNPIEISEVKREGHYFTVELSYKLYKMLMDEFKIKPSENMGKTVDERRRIVEAPKVGGAAAAAGGAAAGAAGAVATVSFAAEAAAADVGAPAHSAPLTFSRAAASAPPPRVATNDFPSVVITRRT